MAGVVRAPWPFLGRPRVRLPLWALLALLTLAMFSLRAHASWDFAPLQSVHAFDSLALTAAVFHTWLAVLLVLLVSGMFSKPDSHAEPVLLSCVFASVSVGSWLLVHLGRVGDTFALADTQAFVRDGFFSSDTLSYYGHPGSATVAASIANITGLSTPDVRTALIFTDVLLFVVISHTLVATWLDHEPRAWWIAAWAVIALTLSSQPFYSVFSAYSAGSLGITVLLPLFLLLQIKYQRDRTPGWGLLIIAVVGALTITHFATAFIALLIISSLVVWRSGSRRVVSGTFVALAWVVIATWDAVSPFNGLVYSLVNMSGNAMRDLLEYQVGILDKWFLPAQTTANTSSAQPLWARIAWLVWPALLLGSSLIAVVAKLLALRRLTIADRTEISALMALSFLGLLSLFLLDIENAVNRLLLAAPYILVPLVFRFALSLKPAAQQVMLGVFVGTLATLSFATFLAYNDDISQKTSHDSEVAAGRHLELTLRGGDGVRIYGMETGSKHLQYYLSEAYDLQQYQGTIRSQSEADLWNVLMEQRDRFLDSGTANAYSILEFSPRWQETFRRFLGVDPTVDVRWLELQDPLSEVTRLYDNGKVTYFALGSRVQSAEAGQTDTSLSLPPRRTVAGAVP